MFYIKVYDADTCGRYLPISRFPVAEIVEWQRSAENHASCQRRREGNHMVAYPEACALLGSHSYQTFTGDANEPNLIWAIEDYCPNTAYVSIWERRRSPCQKGAIPDPQPRCLHPTINRPPPSKQRILKALDLSSFTA